MAIDLTGGLPADRQETSRRRGWGRIQALGEDVPFVLESEKLGTVSIAAETVVSAFDLKRRAEMPGFPGLYQGGARYRWDGEETYGMLERSTAFDKLTFS